MRFQRFFVFLAIAALCMLQTIDSRTTRIRREDFCAEDTEFPAWKVTFYAFAKWCEDGTVGAKPPKPDEGAK